MARRWTRWAKLSLAAIVAAAVGLGGFAWHVNSATPAFPKTPELDDIELTFDEPSTSKPLLDFLVALRTEWKEADLLPPGEARQIASRALFHGVPPGYDAETYYDGDTGALRPEYEDPRALLGALREVEPPLSELRKALYAPGCLQGTTWNKPELYVLNTWSAAIEALLIEIETLARAGETKAAAEQILRIGERIVSLEQDCANDLATALMLSSTIGSMLQIKVFAVIAWDRAGTYHDALSAFLFRLETRSNPMTKAWGRELAGLEDQLTVFAKSASWFTFDLKDTLAMFRTHFRRMVRLSGAPLDPKLWSGPFPEIVFARKVADLPGPSWLRYNHQGLRMYSEIAGTNRIYPIKWHQDQCVLIARRAFFAVWLKSQGLEVEPLLSRPASHPFAPAPFAGTREVVCATPAEFAHKAIKGRAPDNVPQLPGWSKPEPEQPTP